MVLKHQLSILEDLTHALCEELKGNHNQQKQAEIKKRFREQHKVVEVHLKDVERVDKQAEGINTSVNTPPSSNHSYTLTFSTANPPPGPKTKTRKRI